MARIGLGFALMAMSTMTLAHSGHGADSVLANMLHPLFELDHLGGLLVVGVLAIVMLGKRSRQKAQRAERSTRKD